MDHVNLNLQMKTLKYTETYFLSARNVKLEGVIISDN